EEGACVVAGGGVTLEENLVATALMVLTAEEMVQPNFIQGSLTGIRGDVSTNTDTVTLCALHECRSIPAQVVTVAAFEFFIAGVFGFLVGRNGVDIVGRGHH